MEEREDTVHDLHLFEKMDQAIRKDQLFTQHGMGREHLCRLLGVNRNRFAEIMRKYSGERNVCAYLNRMRMEYAVSMMREHPNWSLAAIIESCGMSLTPFKKCFKETYGMPPSAPRI